MIHGIYLKTRKKGLWRLCSISESLEMAVTDSEKFLKEMQQTSKPIKEDDVQVAIQSFDSNFHIPEFLKEIKTKKLLYN